MTTIKDLISGLKENNFNKADLIKVYTRKYLEAGQQMQETLKEIEALKEQAKEKGLLFKYVTIQNTNSVLSNIYDSLTYDARQTGFYFNFQEFHSFWNTSNKDSVRPIKYPFEVLPAEMEKYIKYVIQDMAKIKGYQADRIQEVKGGYKVTGYFWNCSRNEADNYRVRQFIFDLFNLNGVEVPEIKVQDDSILIDGQAWATFTAQKNGKIIIKGV